MAKPDSCRAGAGWLRAATPPRRRTPQPRCSDAGGGAGWRWGWRCGCRAGACGRGATDMPRGRAWDRALDLGAEPGAGPGGARSGRATFRGQGWRWHMAASGNPGSARGWATAPDRRSARQRGRTGSQVRAAVPHRITGLRGQAAQDHKFVRQRRAGSRERAEHWQARQQISTRSTRRTTRRNCRPSPAWRSSRSANPMTGTSSCAMSRCRSNAAK